MVLRVFLVDDHDVVRDGLRALFEAEDDLEVAGEAGTVEEAVGRAAACSPDLALVDVRLPDGDGVEVCRRLRDAVPGIKCVMLTAYVDDRAMFDALDAGVDGFLLKSTSRHDLVDAVRKVGAGQQLVDPSVTRRVLDRLRGGPSAEEERLNQLSARERQVLDLIAEGLTNRKIAERLFLSEKTVKNYISSLLAKLGVERRTEAAVFALRAQAGADQDV